MYITEPCDMRKGEKKKDLAPDIAFGIYISLGLRCMDHSEQHLPLFREFAMFYVLTYDLLFNPQ